MNIELKFTRKNRYKIANFCPCGKKNDDGKFCPFENYEDKGKCFSCGKVFFPTKEKDITYNFPAETEKTKPNYQTIQRAVGNLATNFHSFAQKVFNLDLSENFERWGVGGYKDTTIFLLKNRVGETINLKYVNYGSDGKRNKDKNPYYYKGCEKCLFGLHLYDKNKPVILVESEKTAFLCSLFLEDDFNILATGGASGAKLDYFLPLLDNKIYLFCDNDEAGKNNATIKHLSTLNDEKKIQLKIIDCFDDKAKGYDLADYLLDIVLNNGNLDDFKLSVKKWIKECQYLAVENKNKKSDSNDKSDTKDSKDSNDTNDMTETIETTNVADEKPENTEKSKIQKIEDYLKYKYDLRLNILSNELEYKLKYGKTYSILNENNLYTEVLKLGFKGIETEMKRLLGSDFVTQYNPIHFYFENLPIPKDTKKDYINELANHIGFDDESEKKRFLIHFKKHLVRCVAQAYGIVNKQCLVLVGKKQDTGKSTFIRFLVPEVLKNFLTDTLVLNNKDGLFCLYENFIINLDELKSFKKDDTNQIKSMMSMSKVKERRHYGRNKENLPRYANFFGSTNNDDFLIDETGSIRWVCFGEVISIDFSYKNKININNVWWQAYHLYKQAFDYEMSNDEKQQSEQINKNYSEQTDEDVLVLQHFAPDNSKNKMNFTTPTEIAIYIEQYIKACDDLVKKLNTVKIGKTLKRLNFPDGQSYVKEVGYQKKGYYAKKLTTIPIEE